MKKLKWLWDKFGFITLKSEGTNLQVTVNFPFVSGLVIGAIMGGVIW